MLIRSAQLAIAVFGMALVLHWGIQRDPGWGETSALHPVVWTMHWVPLAGGILCLLLTFISVVFISEE